MSSCFNDNFTKHVGYNYNGYKGVIDFFNKKTTTLISKKVTQLLIGVDEFNRRIIVPDHIIENVMSDVYDSFRPQTGSIYSRYTVSSEYTPNEYQTLVNQVIEIIVSDVKNNIEIEQNNKKLSAWTTVLGDFNDHGLRRHDVIKTNNKHPQRGLFNMNY